MLRRCLQAGFWLGLAFLLTSCFGGGGASLVPSSAPGGSFGVTGRLQVDLDPEIPAAGLPSAPRFYPLASPPAGGLGGEAWAAPLSLFPSRDYGVQGDAPERYWLLSHPNDPKLPEQWNLGLVRLPEAWALAAREGPPLRPVPVALVDTRVCAEHEDLLPRELWTGFDLVNPRDNEALACPPAGAPDSARHGTLVAGVFAAAGDNGRGIAPASWLPGAGGGSYLRPIAVRALSDEGRGSTKTVAQGIRTAVDDGGARVVNLSLGVRFDGSDPRHREERETLFAAVGDAVAAGSLLVAAAGNEGRYGLMSPADHPHVLAVGATDHRGRRTDYSNRGQVDLVAPGGTNLCRPALVSTFGRDGYGCATGTSFAAPHVAAAAAMLMALGVDDPGEVAALLRFTARGVKDGNTVLYDKTWGHSDEYGWGMLDVAGAVRLRALPRIFLARVHEGVVEPVGGAVHPAPDGLFHLVAAAWEDGVSLVAWADSNRDGRLDEGDFFVAHPLTAPGRSLDVGTLVAVPYRGQPREVAF